MTFFIATKNRKKLAEMLRILKPLGISAICEADLDKQLEEVEETGTTFAENAMLKAEAGCKATGLPAVADDSGLMVDCLGGAPGVYSKRYSGEDGNDERNIQKLLTALKDVPESERTAHFVSSVCAVWPDGRMLQAEGRCDGVIAQSPSGSGGFGYDPVFLYGGVSFAELSAEEKDAVSHRGKALKAFKEKLEKFIKETENADK